MSDNENYNPGMKQECERNDIKALESTNGTRTTDRNAREIAFRTPERPDRHERDDSADTERDTIALPSHVAGSGTLDRLVETAR